MFLTPRPANTKWHMVMGFAQVTGSITRKSQNSRTTDTPMCYQQRTVSPHLCARYHYLHTFNNRSHQGCKCSIINTQRKERRYGGYNFMPRLLEPMQTFNSWRASAANSHIVKVGNIGKHIYFDTCLDLYPILMGF